MRLVVTPAMIAATPWLVSQASCFSSPGPHSRKSILLSSRAQREQNGRNRGAPFGASAATSSSLFLSQSANDNLSGFHYDQEPRGTSFISQVSQQDLWERRQLRRPQRRAEMREARRVRPNSRGGGYRPTVNGIVAGPMNVNGVGAPGPGGDSGGGAMGMDNNQNFEAFKESVSANLKSMTELLREMQLSQNIQSNDVQALGRRVADMAERLYGSSANNAGNQSNGGNPKSTVGKTWAGMPSSNKWEDKNFGTSLDGEFNQKIKDVLDEFDVVQQQGAAAAAANNYYGGMGAMSGAGEAYYREKIAQLEARINEIDESLKVTEDKFNTQMEYVDMLVNQRLDDIDADGAFAEFEFDAMPPHAGPGVPGSEPFPPPPPPSFEQQQNMQSMPPPPPPPMSQEGGQPNESTNAPPPPYSNMDDGRGYYQERNYNNFHEPSRPREISSSQKQQQTKSVNTRSGGHHYNDKNTSFMSSFSKMDNDRRREFQPFRDARRNQVRINEQLPRGVTNTPNRRFSVVGPPPMPMVEQPNAIGGGAMGGGMDFYGEEPYYYEDGGPMMGMGMMEDEYFYDDMMY